MKTCPNCKKTYDDEANFCPEEACATDEGPRRLQVVAAKGPRFVPVQRLGGTRTGEVWLAEDRETGAQVALKFLLASVTTNPVTMGRLDRELKQLLRVNNPHVVRVIETGKLEDGRFFVASQLVEQAESLQTSLRRGPASLEQAKAVIAQIGEGLLEAQKAGLVHRDLSPKNVLIDAAGVAKVINFAVPVQVDERLSGVAEYASPEQAQGRPVDQRSNTYSLACIFYHLITGEPPFSGPDPRAVFELHNSSFPLAPSQRRPDAGLGPEVDRVLLKALDKNSSKRPLTLRLFLNEIDALTAVAAAAPAAASGRGEVGFAKTMLFAGGQAEVQQMVQKAIAQRQAAAGAGGFPEAAPVAPAAAQPAAIQVARPAPAAAPVSAARGGYNTPPPAAADGSPMGAARLTPPPVTPHPLEAPGAPFKSAPAPTGASGGGNSGKGAAFRETLWFKTGDVEQMVAEAKAKAAAIGVAPDKEVVAVANEDIRPIEDRYVDDGSVTTDDRKRFSLRTGGTATSIPTVGRALPGDKMSEEDIVGELAPGRKVGVMIGVVVAVVVAIVAVLMFMGGGKKEAAPAPAAAAGVMAPPASAVPPAPPPSTAAPVAAVADPAADGDPEPAAPAVNKRAGRTVSAKKRAAAAKARK